VAGRCPRRRTCADRLWWQGDGPQPALTLPTYRYIQAISRAADILELIGNSPQGLALRAVVHATGLPKQTAFNILETLVHKGLLTKLAGPVCYRLSAVMAGLGKRQAQWTRRLLLKCLPTVFRLSRATGANTGIAHYTGGQVLARVWVPVEPTDQPIVRYSYRMLPYGAAGLVVQAYMSPAELQDFPRRYPLSDMNSSEVFCPSCRLLDKLLDAIRGEGLVAYHKGGISRAAAPIFAGSSLPDSVLMAVTPASPCPQPFSSTRELVRAAAAELSVLLASQRLQSSVAPAGGN